MQNPQINPNIAPRQTPDLIRPLGSTEHLFWLIDRNRSIHFTLVAEIDRVLTRSAWNAALLALQQRHPLLCARIVADGVAAPAFQRDPAARIPLRVVENVQQAWQVEAAVELSGPFDWSNAPLLRVTLLQHASGSTIVLAAHHAVLDGMGGAYLLEDLLRALAGGSLAPLPVAPPLESLLRTQMDSAAVSGPPAPAPEAKAFRPAVGARAEVAALALSAQLTQAIAERARIERTTVHGAVAAAVHEAGRRISRTWRERPVRTVSPIDVRATVGGMGRANGVYITQTITVDERPRGAPFWDAARDVKAQLAPAQTLASVAQEIKALDGFITTNPSIEHAAGFLSHVLAFDVLLSNLGREPIASSYDGFTLNALWGPIVSSGFADDQVIGVCTLGGVLRLTQASYNALPGLLDEVQTVLGEAVAV
ncbi:condensation domain-containing protein [Paraburkholderia sp. MMS20-SJTR3]|uniref:Phthiocerol/phthiodiolone dimycocerosyl transferase n=1 Tax=Paraburkholderia sejongensis TaxID=2886946 RepID=A0ABS8JRI6_9BURK|nr:condensation domain-containing protein [Paraburkholderia sp. MMS20-SJTR3]MCC8392442.1 condensation domain-containing protein [Paraburkholderia sp. MMS20-SJTR3]